MNAEIQILTDAYNDGAHEEYMRLASPIRKKLEFETICRYIESHAADNAVIIDIGCGPGRYAEHFLEKGHSVGCVDLSAKSLKLLSDRIEPTLSNKLLFNTVSCATSLDWIDRNTADIILLMGPMYHLTGNYARLKVLQHCHRILKPNGKLAVMYLSHWPVIDENTTSLTTIEPRRFGIKTYTLFQNREVPQFRCQPHQAIKEASGFFREKLVIPIKDEDETINSQTEAKLTTSQFVVIYERAPNP